ncbi:hypothetical protein [Lederbergia lenta]|uniref:hypothetical protein n=1 Tax=Lederbergia lenta TaxID=1467 RepID=UPI00203EB58C|nr:hypothetical protein [Lederbergia lenta]MCM3109649.1 hypothetical protein [Lederbergia lenta]
MSKKQELAGLENEWKERFDRFTAPEPTRENTIDLIQKIKEVEEIKPIDIRTELETAQTTQTIKEKVTNAFLSQWNFYGSTSWLLTGVIMLILTITISQNTQNEMTGFLAWIKWISLIMIAVTGYAFRSKNEGNQIIETLSYYPLIQQMFTRFIFVMGLQLIITLPLSFFILGNTNSYLYLIGAFTPLFFFGVIGFISTMWFGQKTGVILTVFVWSTQILFDKQFHYISLFQLPENDYFLFINACIFTVSILLLSSILVKQRLLRKN